MHEIGLVDDIVYAINAALRKSGKNSRIKKVNIDIGELEHITTEHFEFHFKQRSRGTPFENAELNFKKIKASFKCRDCSTIFSVQEGLAGCPKCKSKLSEVVEGSGIKVESIELK